MWVYVCGKVALYITTLHNCSCLNVWPFRCASFIPATTSVSQTHTRTHARARAVIYHEATLTCFRLSTLAPTVVPKLLATSLAPTAKARINATTKPTINIHSSGASAAMCVWETCFYHLLQSQEGGEAEMFEFFNHESALGPASRILAVFLGTFTAANAYVRLKKWNFPRSTWCCAHRVRRAEKLWGKHDRKILPLNLKM